MRVAIITELAFPDSGGQAVRYRELGSYLVRQGHVVDVFTIRHQQNLPVEESVDGVRIFRCVSSIPYIKYRWPGRSIRGIFSFACSIRRQLYRMGREYDIVLFNQWPLFHVIMSHTVREYRILVDWCEIRSDPIMRLLQRALVKKGDMHICVSEGVRDQLLANYGADEDRTLVLESGIFFDRYREHIRGQRENPALIFVGRLVRHKRVDLAIEAFRRVLELSPRARFTITGDGPLRGRLMEQYKDLVSGGQLVFTGFVDESKKIDLYAASDFFVITSEREGFPRVVAEAMASSVPVVTTNYIGNGTADVVRRHGVGVISRHDADDVAKSMLDLWWNPKGYEAVAAACRRYAASLDWSVICTRLLEMRSE